jgi:hypothetical protein
MREKPPSFSPQLRRWRRHNFSGRVRRKTCALLLGVLMKKGLMYLLELLLIMFAVTACETEAEIPGSAGGDSAKNTAESSVAEIDLFY